MFTAHILQELRLYMANVMSALLWFSKLCYVQLRLEAGSAT